MCGNTDPLFTQMRELPVDIYEIDFPANFAEARKIIGLERTLCGNVPTITDLLEGPPENLRAMIRYARENN
jgi:uroporphyrinogen-III decarboxylase